MKGADQTMQTTNVVAKTARNAEREPLTLQKRCGSTTYVVSVHFCEEAKETLEDKILRLMEKEAAEYELTA
jgi:hypothetical protein